MSWPFWNSRLGGVQTVQTRPLVHVLHEGPQPAHWPFCTKKPTGHEATHWLVRYT